MAKEAKKAKPKRMVATITFLPLPNVNGGELTKAAIEKDIVDTLNQMSGHINDVKVRRGSVDFG